MSYVTPSAVTPLLWYPLASTILPPCQTVVLPKFTIVLQALLAKATSMDDIITIESAISETEWDIENLSGTLRRYDALVDYATIDVELSEVYKLSGQDEAVTTFGGRLGQSFVNGLQAVGSALEDFAVWLAYSWVWLLVIAAVIVVIVRVVRRKSGGKKFSLKRKGKDADAETKE